ncbi:MAG: FMN-binding negative transcriptional regulator [Leptospira sp.]|nr:FMN-binding negative transcriptional regulator [Leptospira sp.]
MYTPADFKFEDAKEIESFLQNNAFATMFTSKDSSHSATHVPLLLSEDKKYLIGHLSKANPQGRLFLDKPKVLCVFLGPHCYISPSWYESNRAVPTWNYISVHISGILRIVSDPQKIRSNLQQLVDTYETDDSKYVLNDVDSQYLSGLEKGIINFEIEILEVEAKKKLSQNHSIERQMLVIDNLEKSQSQNEMLIAQEMRKNLQ